MIIPIAAPIEILDRKIIRNILPAGFSKIMCVSYMIESGGPKLHFMSETNKGLRQHPTTLGPCFGSIERQRLINRNDPCLHGRQISLRSVRSNSPHKEKPHGYRRSPFAIIRKRFSCCASLWFGTRHDTLQCTCKLA